jgi:hypothetical protein
MPSHKISYLYPQIYATEFPSLLSFVPDHSKFMKLERLLLSVKLFLKLSN